MSDNPKHGESCHEFTQRILRETDDKPTHWNCAQCGQWTDQQHKGCGRKPTVGLTGEQIKALSKKHLRHVYGRNKDGIDCVVEIIRFAKDIEAIVRKDCAIVADDFHQCRDGLWYCSITEDAVRKTEAEARKDERGQLLKELGDCEGCHIEEFCDSHIADAILRGDE